MQHEKCAHDIYNTKCTYHDNAACIAFCHRITTMYNDYEYTWTQINKNMHFFRLPLPINKNVINYVYRDVYGEFQKKFPENRGERRPRHWKIKHNFKKPGTLCVYKTINYWVSSMTAIPGHMGRMPSKTSLRVTATTGMVSHNAISIVISFLIHRLSR